MDLDSKKKPTSEDKEGVWFQYCETLLRTAASLWGMKERKGIEVGWSVHRAALRMIKSDGWHKYWEIQRSIWETLKYTNHYMGERMERMGNEDIYMLWRLDYLQYLVHLYESQGRKRAAHWAQIELVMEQKKVDKKVEKKHEEEEKSEGMSEEKKAVVGKDAEEEDNEESEGDLKSCEDEDNLSEEKEEEEAKDAIEEEKAKDAGEEHQEESEGELKRSEDKDNSMETENELEVRKEDKDKHEDEANKNCEVGNAEDLVDEEEVKESVEDDVDESEGELGNDRGTTQEEEVAECVLEERYNRESTPGRLEMLKNMDNWTHGSFYLNTGPIVLGGKRTKTFLGGG